MKEQKDNIYADKIRLSAVIIDKEFTVITNFCNLMSGIRDGRILKEDLDRHPDKSVCVQNLVGLYYMLEYDYSDKLTKEELNKVKGIIDKFEMGEDIQITDIVQVVRILRRLMSATGFHDVLRKQEQQDEWSEQSF